MTDIKTYCMTSIAAYRTDTLHECLSSAVHNAKSFKTFTALLCESKYITGIGQCSFAFTNEFLFNDEFPGYVLKLEFEIVEPSEDQKSILKKIGSLMVQLNKHGYEYTDSRILNLTVYKSVFTKSENEDTENTWHDTKLESYSYFEFEIEDLINELTYNYSYWT